jgi:hypothetical protein
MANDVMVHRTNHQGLGMDDSGAYNIAIATKALPMRASVGKLLISRRTTRTISPHDCKLSEQSFCKMRLSNEAGQRWDNPSWHIVRSAVEALDCMESNSFCILECTNGSYVQTLQGLNGYHAEWRQYWAGEEIGSGGGDRGHV